MVSKLENAYASAAATTQQLREEGQEQSPLLPFLKEAEQSIREDAKLSNILDPDYVESDIGSIISLVAPQLKENVLERKLAEQAEIDKQIWFSQAGQRELQAEETRNNALNSQAAQAQAALKRKIETESGPILSRISPNKEDIPLILSAITDNPSEKLFTLLEKVDLAGDQLSIEAAGVVPGTPDLSFTKKDGRVFHVFTKPNRNRIVYRDSIKNIWEDISGKLTTGLGLSEELVEKFKRKIPLNSEESKQLINNSKYNSFLSAALLKNQNAIRNYPPISNQLSEWQEEYNKRYQTRILTSDRLLTNALLEQKKALNAFNTAKINDPNVALGPARKAEANLEQAQGHVNILRKQVEKDLLNTGVHITNSKQKIAFEMVRIARRRGTNVNKANAKEIRQEAWQNVQIKNLEDTPKNTKREIKSTPPPIVGSGSAATPSQSTTSSTLTTPEGTRGRLLGTDLNIER